MHAAIKAIEQFTNLEAHIHRCHESRWEFVSFISKFKLQFQTMNGAHRWTFEHLQTERNIHSICFASKWAYVIEISVEWMLQNKEQIVLHSAADTNVWWCGVHTLIETNGHFMVANHAMCNTHTIRASYRAHNQISINPQHCNVIGERVKIDFFQQDRPNDHSVQRSFLLL